MEKEKVAVPLLTGEDLLRRNHVDQLPSCFFRRTFCRI